MPIIFAGLGVDDLPLIEQSGSALKHAGVSITVTSITDIMAFGIGATTVSNSHSFHISLEFFKI